MASKRKLGINFDTDALSIVEIEKRGVVARYYIPYLDSQDKAEVVEVADQIRLAAILQKTLREKAIKTDELLATIPANDVLLRSFLIPSLPQREVKAAIDFEARKYVPIKLDLLYFDYLLQKVKDKNVKKLKTHFVGIKKEILDKFTYALEQSNLKVASIETSPFSLFRILIYKKLIKLNSSIVIIEAGEEEGNICIIEKGFPQLIRDFKLTAVSKDVYAKEPETLSSILNKEVRLSFDYYLRQSPRAVVNQIFVFTESKDGISKESLNKEFNVPVTIIDVNEIFGSREDIKLGELKAFGAALGSFVPTPIKIDFYSKRKALEIKEKKEEIEIQEIQVSPKAVIRTAIVSAICILLFYLFVDYSQISRLKSNLDMLVKKRSSLRQKVSSLELLDLQSIKSDYEEQITVLNEAKKVTYLTPLLNTLPAIIPKGVWLNKIDFRIEPNIVLKMDGKAYQVDESQQIDSVNRLLTSLKASPEFKKVFSFMDFDFIRQASLDEVAVTEFSITCK